MSIAHMNTCVPPQAAMRLQHSPTPCVLRDARRNGQRKPTATPAARHDCIIGAGSVDSRRKGPGHEEKKEDDGSRGHRADDGSTLQYVPEFANDRQVAESFETISSRVILLSKHRTYVANTTGTVRSVRPRRPALDTSPAGVLGLHVA